MHSPFRPRGPFLGRRRRCRFENWRQYRAVARGAGVFCAFTTYRSQKISTFLQIFVAIFAAETVVFGTVFLIAEVGLWPPSLEDYAFPESLPLTVAIFAILVYAIASYPGRAIDDPHRRPLFRRARRDPRAHLAISRFRRAASAESPSAWSSCLS